MSSIVSLPNPRHLPLLNVLDLEPESIVASQRTSSRLLKLARDNRLWRYKCFEKSPSAAALNADKPDALANLTGALGGLSLSESPRSTSISNRRSPRPSKRAKRVTEWDQSSEHETIDWYSEYISRHAPLSTIWCEARSEHAPEVRGVALHENSQKAVGCLDDGSICIWDIRDRPYSRRKFEELSRSKPGELFQSHAAESSIKRTIPTFKGVVECVNIDSYRQKAFFAVDQTLNEVDLETLEVVSQSTFAWPITALSQQGSSDIPLSVGTSWSLHLYDARAPLRDRSRSPEDLLRTTPGDPEESIAFLPNYAKSRHRAYDSKPLPTSPAPIVTQRIGSTARRSRGTRPDLSDFAHMEPGPLSIVHHEENAILIAGRFPSILAYDRRAFPRLQYVMHSGARLSSLTTVPHPLQAASTNPRAQATLIACGEYGGRGSLELYSLLRDRQDTSTRQSSGDFGLGSTSPELGAADREHALSSSESPPYSYKNRQEASSSKLLSVATQGTKIVFSDAEGGIKWVERHGRGLARRWNINAWQCNAKGGSPSGELVARKMVPLHTMESERGDRGDSDLLIWTGEKIGLITTKPQWEPHDELVKSFEGMPDLRQAEEREKAEEYSKTMRRALERQADERRWMSQFRLKRGLF
jgi:hypothetical protein